MRKIYSVVAAAAALASICPAVAQTTIIYDASGAVPSYIKGPTTIETFTPDSPVANGTPLNSTAGILGSATSVPGQVRIFNSTVLNQAVQPPSGSGQFLAIGGNNEHSRGAYTLGFGSQGAQVVSFAFSTLDDFNRVVLNFSNATSQTLNGLQIIGSPANVHLGVGGRVTYDRGGSASISSIVFSSAGTAFEIDSVLSAAPEPGTWGMMIVGFGLAGAALRVRRRENKLAQA